MQIRTHKYAERAYPLVEAIKGTDTEAKYRTLVLNFPTMIMQSGLAQALGFLLAKGSAEHIQLLAHIAQLFNQPDGKALHQAVLHSDITQYQLLTRKALEASSWLKRYTQALLDKSHDYSDDT